jgi:hypothetical protein
MNIVLHRAETLPSAGVPRALRPKHAPPRRGPEVHDFQALDAGSSTFNFELLTFNSFLSRIEARPQFRRHNRTNIFATPEHAVANPRNEVIRKIKQPARNHAQHRRQHGPSTTQSPQNMQKRTRSRQQLAVTGQHHNAVRQSRSPLHRNSRLKRRALQRRKPKRRTAAIVLQHKLYGPMTQPAMSIVKKIFPGRRVWHHQKSIARATAPLFRAPPSRAAFASPPANRTYGNVSRFALATVSETL